MVVAGGAVVGLAASQANNPKAPLSQALNHIPQAASYTEKQMQDAVNQAKHEVLASLGTLENFSLQGAIEAALLTRTAYDVFVSPLIKAGATVAGDVLVTLLNAVEVGRNWLKTINHDDNVTLAALQKVLQSWVDNVNHLPRQLNAIADTDLDGAQAYLHALQLKIQEETKALNPTPTPPKVNPTPTPKK